MIASFLLLFLVLFPGIGVKAGNARRWIRFNGFGFQPSELLKFTLIVWLSGFLDRKKEVLGYFSKGIFPLLLVMGVYISLLVLQPDFGMAMLISLTLFIMLFVAGAKPTHMIISIVGLAGVAVTLIQAKPYRLRRLIFWDPWADPLDAGYQLIQSFIAFGTGGIFGKGLGNSQQKIFFLPEGHTDFIFSILAEEIGFIGVLGTLILIVLMMKKGFEISCSCRNEFGQNLAFGITLLITLQSILHIGVVVGLLPTKGIPLPFVSYGGTSLVLNMFLIGVLVNIAREKVSR
jgi:cell division protein FtsW